MKSLSFTIVLIWITILSYSQESFEGLRSDTFYFHELRSGLPYSGKWFKEKETGIVAYLGGSITYNPGWRDSINLYMLNSFHETDFEFINAGIPSFGSTPDAFRLEYDVLSKGKINLLFIDCAVNDRANGRTSQERLRAVEGIVRHAWDINPKMDIVFLYFVDPMKMEDYRSGKVPAEIQDYENIAQHYGITSINLAKEVTYRIDVGEFTWEDDFKNLHPSQFGQGVYSSSIEKFLEEAYGNLRNKQRIIYGKSLPAMIDEFSYDAGILVSNKEVRIINGWEIIEHWKPTDRGGTRAGYVNIPMLVTESPGSEISFDFEGRAVGITVVAGPDVGMIEYRVDDLPWEILDLFTSWSNSLHLPWYYLLYSELEKGNHSLQLKTTNFKNIKSKGNACRIAHFFVNK